MIGDSGIAAALAREGLGPTSLNPFTQVQESASRGVVFTSCGVFACIFPLDFSKYLRAPGFFDKTISSISASLGMGYESSSDHYHLYSMAAPPEALDGGQYGHGSIAAAACSLLLLSLLAGGASSQTECVPTILLSPGRTATDTISHTATSSSSLNTAAKEAFKMRPATVEKLNSCVRSTPAVYIHVKPEHILVGRRFGQRVPDVTRRSSRPPGPPAFSWW